jgi:hypothetical protein
VDPLAEKRVEWTNYNSMRCNPIINIDLDGALDTDFKDKIAHVFLDELTDDQEVKEALVLFAYENIMAKQYHDLPYIISYMNNGKKAQFKQLVSMANNTYMFDIPYILHYKLNI